MAFELLDAHPGNIELSLALPDWIEQHRKWLDDRNIRVEAVSEEVLEKISSLQTPNKVYLLVSMAPAPPAPERVENGLSLFLDGIQDPGNLGTILRIADWFGLAAVFCAPHCVEWANPKVIQASMGSFFRTPVEYVALPALRERFPALPCWGTSMEGQSIYTAAIPSRALIVIGSEAHGISAETAALMDSWTGIPSFGEGGSESLNAAVAAGIACAVLRGRGSGMSPIRD